MTLDLVETRVRSGASSPDPSMVVADIPRGIGQGQLAASGMLARMGAIVRRRHLSQPPRPSAAVTAVRTWRRRPGRAVLAGTLIAILAVQAPIAALAQTVVVGGKNYTEQLLMAEMTSQLLTAKGLRVETRSGFDTTSLRKAQETGVVDLYWEYTGTSLWEFNKATESSARPKLMRA
jgi:Substrate binding domain of ABC-type glycine betaine transport system